LEGAVVNVDILSDLGLVASCIAYALLVWLLQQYRVVAPRDWLRQRIWDVNARPEIAGSLSDKEAKNLKCVQESIKKGWWRLPTSRVQAGWRHVHGLEDRHILEGPEDVADEQLRTERARLAALPGKEAKDFVLRIDAEFKEEPDPPAGRSLLKKAKDLVKKKKAARKAVPKLKVKRALLQDARIFRHNLSDTDYEDLAAILAKAVWLTVLALAIVAGLGVLFDRESYFLLGAAGALISRLTRVLTRRPKAADYGAAWSTLILSPAAGALAGWLGVLTASALSGDPFNVLDDSFSQPWNDATSQLGLLVAFIAGFSERWFNRLVGVAETQLGGKLPAEKASVDNEKPKTIPSD
jgi:hypothetical protein